MDRGSSLADGEIQIIPDANIFDPEVSNGAASTAWKAIMPDGSLVDPGTAGTLKYNSTFKLVTALDANTGTPNGSYTSMAHESDINVPEIAKGLILYPDDPGGDYGGDWRWWNVEGERMPLCGGYWRGGSRYGVFCVDLNAPRSDRCRHLGARSAFVEL